MLNKSDNIKIYVYQIVLFIVLLGGINWLILGAFNFNLIKNVIGSSNIESIVYMLVGICSIALLFKKNIFLPFLDETVYPKPLNDVKNNGTETTTLTNLPCNTKVIYWAAKSSSTDASNPEEAYNDYSNYGIGTTDNNGEIKINFYKPGRYSVSCKGLLPSHVHYRYWKSNDMLSRVRTKDL